MHIITVISTRERPRCNALKMLANSIAVNSSSSRDSCVHQERTNERYRFEQSLKKKKFFLQHNYVKIAGILNQ